MEGRRTVGGGYNNNNTLIRVVYLHASTYISSLSPSSVLTALSTLSHSPSTLLGRHRKQRVGNGGGWEWANDFYVHGV